MNYYVPSYLFEAWQVVGSHFDMIFKVWEPCGLVRAFEKNFQASPIKENAKCSLFASTFNVVGEEIS